MVAHDKAPGLYELPGLPQGARPQGARMIDAALVLIQQNNIGEKSSHWTDRGARGSDEVKVDATAHRGIQSAGKSVEGDANHQFLTEFMAADKTYMDLYGPTHGLRDDLARTHVPGERGLEEQDSSSGAWGTNERPVS